MSNVAGNTEIYFMLGTQKALLETSKDINGILVWD